MSEAFLVFCLLQIIEIEFALHVDHICFKEYRRV